MELIGEFIGAVRASQTASQTLDHAIAEYMGIDDTAFRCLDVLDQEGPMSAGRLAERARLSPGATTTLIDRLERKGFARRTRDTEDRRKVLVEVTPRVRAMGQQLYGTHEEAAAGLARYSDRELRLLTEFMRSNTAFQVDHMRRLDALRESDAPP